jgi:hypothetical protein
MTATILRAFVFALALLAVFPSRQVVPQTARMKRLGMEPGKSFTRHLPSSRRP